MLDLGRLEAGVTTLEQQPIKLRDLIKRAVRAIESWMQSKNMAIVADIPGIQIQGDQKGSYKRF